jgi:hypothetical protein
MSLTIESTVGDGEENVNFEPDEDTSTVESKASSTSSSATVSGGEETKERKKLTLTKKGAPKQKGRGFKRSFEEGEERSSAYAGKVGYITLFIHLLYISVIPSSGTATL